MAGFRLPAVAAGGAAAGGVPAAVVIPRRESDRVTSTIEVMPNFEA